MTDFKTTAPRDDSHLAFVRCFGCCVCGQMSDAHHEFGNLRGTASKPSDFGAIPLCRKHHAELHWLGLIRFERLHSVDLMEVGLNLLHYRLTGQPLTMHLSVVKDFNEYLLVAA